LNQTLRERIVAHIDSRNTIYEKYFSSLNKLTPRNKVVPQWSVHEESTEGVTFVLSGGPDIVAALEESSHVLAEELGNILLAEQFTARYRDGTIRVHRRQGGNTQ
jgi:MarR-like DNA-binding transcriptional regulator SgrR of sgrS sRNA